MLTEVHVLGLSRFLQKVEKGAIFEDFPAGTDDFRQVQVLK